MSQKRTPKINNFFCDCLNCKKTQQSQNPKAKLYQDQKKKLEQNFQPYRSPYSYQKANLQPRSSARMLTYRPQSQDNELVQKKFQGSSHIAGRIKVQPDRRNFYIQKPKRLDSNYMLPTPLKSDTMTMEYQPKKQQVSNINPPKRVEKKYDGAYQYNHIKKQYDDPDLNQKPNQKELQFRQEHIKKVQKLQLEKHIQAYKAQNQGLIMQAKCSNPECQAYQCSVQIPKGYNQFNIAQQIFECRCPLCKQPIEEAHGFGFRNADVNFRGRNQSLGKFQGRQRVTEFGRFYQFFGLKYNKDIDLDNWNFINVRVDRPR